MSEPKVPPSVVINPDLIIHVGRPDACAPHRDLSKLKTLHGHTPKTFFLVIVWSKLDAEEIEAKFKADPDVLQDKVGVLVWETDPALLRAMIDRLDKLVGAQIVSPRWLVCVNHHETREDPHGDLDHCSECGQAVALMTPFKERMAKFIDVFASALKLANFDTGSANVLFNIVDPRRNILLNMRYAFGKRQAKDLKGLGKGKTVYVVGAGPSLEDQIEPLKRLSETGIVMCVGRVYKKLREAGVKVHYTHSCEMFDWDAEIFKGVGDVGSTVLLFASVCAPTTVEEWPGEKVCVWDAETASMLKRDDWVVGGNSVTHHMMNFAAQILDADEIVLVGVDLAYTKLRTHAEGTTPSTWPAEAIQKDATFHEEDYWVECTGEDPLSPECHRMTFSGGLVPKADHEGEQGHKLEVRSSGSYENFAKLFEILIDKHGKKVLNACPNGQKIKNAPYVNLLEYKK